MTQPFITRLCGAGLALCFLLSGCAVLTDSQVKNISSFGATTKAYSSFPSAVGKQFADLHQTLQILDAADLADTAHMMPLLSRARATFRDNLQSSGQFDLSLQIIQKYGTLLCRLSSDDFVADLRDPAGDLGENLDKVVTLFDQKTGSKLSASLGSDIAKLVLFAGQKITRHKQTVALKQFVTECDTLVGAVTASLVDAMDVGMKELIRQDSIRFESDVRRMLANEVGADVQRRGVTLERYQAARFYYEGITGYLAVEALRAQVVQAALSLRKSHAALVQSCQEKKDLNELIAETKQFITDVQPLGTIASHFVKLP